MKIHRAYRGWMWRRLAFLLPSQAAALTVNLWLALIARSPLSVRIGCLSIAALLATLIAWLVLQTIRSATFQPRPNLQEARALRRQLRPCGAFAAASLALLLALVFVPGLFSSHPSKGTIAVLPRRAPARRVEIPAPEKSEPAVAAPEEPARPEEPVSVEIVRAEPDFRQVRPLEPARLELPEWNFEAPRQIDVPYVPKPAAGNETVRGQEQELPPFRPDFDEIQKLRPTDRFVFGLLSRPLPDEREEDGWPPPEWRLEGFFLLGRDSARVPGLELTVDLPFARDHSVQMRWISAFLPTPAGTDSDTPNWNRLTLAYVRRLAGYTSHATFDLSVSIGFCADFLRSAAGIPDPGGVPKLAPYIALDAAFWKEGPVGLLIHVGESVPIALIGSSLGATDLSAILRLDVSERISIHAGYRMVILKYRYDDLASSPGVQPLDTTLTGPVIGVDIRF